MEQTFSTGRISVGFHLDGYRLDKTASPMNRYTKWEILSGNRWCNPKAVCFDSLPQNGWIAKDKFDWDRINSIVEQV